MNSIHIFWPLVAHICLTLALLITLGLRKMKAAKTGQVNLKEAALNSQAWPADVIKVSNNIANQFELPVLFYLLCTVLYSINAAGVTAIALAWLFVLSRFAHSYVHTGSNYVPTRFRLFLLGGLAVIAMLLLLAWELATA